MGHTIEIEVVGHASLGGVFDLAGTPSVDIGRSGACAIMLDDPLIAAKHCRVFVENGRVVLRNLDQEIGVYCDGDFVERETVITAEHEVDLGEVRLLVRLRVEQPEPTRASPDPVVAGTDESDA
ncbi:MAG: FHA domain-containing protein, partial [Phycisphaerales bacterium]|nr:FHA domain-containing protein [Phycisphaerales bacterium]